MLLLFLHLNDLEVHEHIQDAPHNVGLENVKHNETDPEFHSTLKIKLDCPILELFREKVNHDYCAESDGDRANDIPQADEECPSL